MDAIDGKQARRTNSTSPLGELFDHGCDSLNIIVKLNIRTGLMRNVYVDNGDSGSFYYWFESISDFTCLSDLRTWSFLYCNLGRISYRSALFRLRFRSSRGKLGNRSYFSSYGNIFRCLRKNSCNNHIYFGINLHYCDKYIACKKAKTAGI